MLPPEPLTIHVSLPIGGSDSSAADFLLLTRTTGVSHSVPPVTLWVDVTGFPGLPVVVYTPSLIVTTITHPSLVVLHPGPGPILHSLFAPPGTCPPAHPTHPAWTWPPRMRGAGIGSQLPLAPPGSRYAGSPPPGRNPGPSSRLYLPSRMGDRVTRRVRPMANTIPSHYALCPPNSPPPPFDPQREGCPGPGGATAQDRPLP